MSESVNSALKARLAAARKKAAEQVQAVPRRPDGVSRIPLSSGQSRLWYMSQIEPESSVNHLVEANRLIGDLDTAALERALNEIVARHESLRTVIRMKGEEPEQIVLDSNPVELSCEDFSTASESDVRSAIAKVVAAPFVLSELPLIRCRLYRLNNDEHVLLLVMHHCISDGVSVSTMIGEIGSCYQSFANGEAVRLAPVELQYADYALWQQEWLESEDARSQLEYWVDHHGGEDTPLNLPLDKARPIEQSYEGGAVRCRIGAGEFQTFEDLLRRESCTPFIGLMAVLSLLLNLYSRQRTINIGVPVAGRSQNNVEGSVGFFANTLVYHLEIDPATSFVEHLRRVRQSCLEGLRRQDIPFDRLVNALNPPRDLSRTPLYQVFFGYQDLRDRGVDFGDVELQPFETDIRVARTDLTLWADQTNSDLSIALEYATDLFAQSSADRMLRQFLDLIRLVTESPHAALHTLNPLTEEELQLQLAANPAPRDFAYSDTLSLLVEAAQRHPEETAVVFGDQSVTYDSLLKRARAITAALEESGLGQNPVVGIHMRRSPDMIAALIGVWMAGGAYLPLDPEFPRQRLEYMVEKSHASTILTELEGVGAEFRGATTLHLSSVGQDSEGTSGRSSADPEDLAYTIYTSGSTGTPKGVRISHGAVANFLQSMAVRPGFTADNRILAVTTLSFDISVLELLLPLSVGGVVVVATRDDAIDADRLAKMIKDHGIDTMQATPATWKMLLSEEWVPPSKGFRALCGGEAMPPNVAGGLLRAGCELWNMYGPTETTIWSTCCRIEHAEQPIPLGDPIDNTECFVVDEFGSICPVGVPGKLLIAGRGLSEGYQGEPELTESRFVDLRLHGVPGERRAYRTGDVVMRDGNGRLLFKGREDAQIKLRGYRIEIGDIEAALLAIDGIEEAAVLVKDLGESDRRLMAFLRFDKQTHMPTTELRRALADRLPVYMVPQQFVTVQAMPLTDNDKIDRNALDRIAARPSQSRSIVEPSTEAERKLVSIWCKALGVDSVSVDKCFFDVGGHSLLAVGVIQRIQAEFGFRVGPREMMLNTLQQIAAMLPEDAPNSEAASRSVGDGAQSILSRLAHLFGRAPG